MPAVRRAVVPAALYAGGAICYTILHKPTNREGGGHVDDA